MVFKAKVAPKKLGIRRQLRRTMEASGSNFWGKSPITIYTKPPKLLFLQGDWIQTTSFQVVKNYPRESIFDVFMFSFDNLPLSIIYYIRIFTRNLRYYVVRTRL